MSTPVTPRDRLAVEFQALDALVDDSLAKRRALLAADWGIAQRWICLSLWAALCYLLFPGPWSAPLCAGASGYALGRLLAHARADWHVHRRESRFTRGCLDRMDAINEEMRTCRKP